MPRLIALTGLIGSGKSTVATHLVRQHGFELVKFAGGLKTMMHALLTYSLIAPDLIDAMIEGRYKESPTSILQGMTPRRAMQTLGTEWGRHLIGEDLWVDIAAARIDTLLKAGTLVVVDDCRYPNEAAVIARLGGEVWKIRRPDLPCSDHASEQDQRLIRPDRVIVNNGTIDALVTAIDRVLRAEGDQS